MAGNNIWLKQNIGIVDVVTAINNITNLASVDLIDRITLIDEITQSKIVGKTGDSTFQAPRIDAVTHAMQMIETEHHEIHEGVHYFIEGSATLDDSPGLLFAKLVTPDTAKWGHFKWSISSNGILTTNLYEIPTGGMTGGARATIHANNRNINCWSGRQDGGDNKSILTDSTQAWTVDALIGMQVFNQTDGSSGFITDNTATTITATLAGGTGNDWDDDDVYEINNSQLVITSGVTTATSLGLLVNTASMGGTGFKSDVGGGTQKFNELVLRQNTTYLRTFSSTSADNIVSFRATWYEHTDKVA